MTRGQHHRLRYPLHTPDSSAWRQRLGYLPELASALKFAYAQLHDSTPRPDRYLQAYSLLLPFRDRAVCLEQRLRLEYALALAYSGEMAIPQALTCLEHCQEIADHLQDPAIRVELSYLAGSLLQLTNHNSAAYDQYAEALNSLRSLEHDGESADPGFELDVVLRLAWRAWDLGRFPTSLYFLDEAYALHSHATSVTASPELAYLAWLDAQISRVRGRPGRAMKQIAPAATLLLQLGQTLNAGRIHTIWAESALDLAEALFARARGSGPTKSWPVVYEEQDQDPQVALGIARWAANQALTLGHQAEDAVGQGMARLAMRRAARLYHRGARMAGSEEPIERVVRAALRLDDPGLRGRALTALGDELVAQGREEAANTVHYGAQRILEEYELGGLALWPRRSLQIMQWEN